MKSSALHARLGEDVARMLEQLSFRGPDSAGVAFYRDPAPAGACKVSLHAQADPDWAAVGVGLAAAFGDASPPRVRASHATFVVYLTGELLGLLVELLEPRNLPEHEEGRVKVESDVDRAAGVVRGLAKRAADLQRLVVSFEAFINGATSPGLRTGLA